MGELGVKPDRLKVAAGWTSEKLGRLKPNAQLRGYSPLSPLVELEGLLIGIQGKLAMWRRGGRGRPGPGPRPRAPRGALGPRRAPAGRRGAPSRRGRAASADGPLSAPLRPADGGISPCATRHAKIGACPGAFGEAEADKARRDSPRWRRPPPQRRRRRRRARARRRRRIARARARSSLRRASSCSDMLGSLSEAVTVTDARAAHALRQPGRRGPAGMRDARGAPGQAAGHDLRPVGVHARGRPPDGGRGRPQLQDRQRAARRAAADPGRQPRDRRAALAAGQGRAPARKRRRDHGRQRDRGRHRGQGGRAAPALPGPGGRDAHVLAGLRGDPAAPGAAGRARPGRLVRGRRRRRQRAPQPRRRRARGPRQGGLRARAAQSLSAGPQRGLGDLRRTALRASRALSGAARRDARSRASRIPSSSRPSARWACARSCSSRWTSPAAPSGC